MRTPILSSIRVMLKVMSGNVFFSACSLTDEVMLITDSGTLVRIAVSDISTMGRNTQGVRLIRLTNEEKLVEIEKIESIEDQEE